MLPFVVILVFVSSDIVLATRENTLLEKPYYNLDDAENIFEQYMSDYEKFYYDETEYETRFETFKENLRNINNWNAMYPLTVFKVNQFSDSSRTEFRRKYTGFVMNTRRYEEEAVDYMPTGDAPETLDYRSQGLVSEVKNQLRCGSCYVFSAIGNIEGQYAKKYGKLESLSEQQCLDCHKSSFGCEGGIMHETIKALATEGGSMKEGDYPYNGGDYTTNTCKFDKSKIVAKVTDAIIYNVTREDDIKDALATTGPLSIAILATDQLVQYGGGIFTAECDPNKRHPNHGVLLVGYGSEGGVDYWIIKNSWSSTWGEKGYVRFLRGKSLCLIGSYIATATVA